MRKIVFYSILFQRMTVWALPLLLCPSSNPLFVCRFSDMRFLLPFKYISISRISTYLHEARGLTPNQTKRISPMSICDGNGTENDFFALPFLMDRPFTRKHFECLCRWDCSVFNDSVLQAALCSYFSYGNCGTIAEFIIVRMRNTKYVILNHSHRSTFAHRRTIYKHPVAIVCAVWRSSIISL